MNYVSAAYISLESLQFMEAKIPVPACSSITYTSKMIWLVCCFNNTVDDISVIDVHAV